MFSPSNDKRAKARFEYYMNGAIEEFKSRDKPEKIDRGRLGKLFVETVEREQVKNIIPVEKGIEMQDVVICQAFLKRYYNANPKLKF